jgi:ATP synthase protein I
MADTDSRRGSSNYARYIGVGFTFVFTLGLLAAVGFFLDRVLGTLPLFLLLGIGIGFAGGLYYVYLVLKKLGNG